MNRANLIAPFENRGGYGYHSRSFADALQRKIEIVRLDLGIVVKREKSGATINKPLADAPCIVLAPPSFAPVRHGSKTICYTVWETSRVPARFIENLHRFDEVWIPTDWGASIFKAAGIPSTKIRVVPEGVDCSLFCPALAQKQRATYQFLYVGKWEERKGTADLVKAFTLEFKPTEPVVLLMHFGHDEIHNRSVRDLLKEELAKSSNPDPRISISTRLPAADLVRLIQCSDAFVLPTKAEGWGLPILEAMACALPCIVTNYGGHLTFANAHNSYLIDIEKMCPVADRHFFPSHLEWGQWAQPDIAHLRHLMRHVFENQEEARQKGRIAWTDAVSWNWINAADIALQALQVGK
jgi:glycosyltransferase involved in cell wall biosynthesis